MAGFVGDDEVTKQNDSLKFIGGEEESMENDALAALLYDLGIKTEEEFEADKVDDELMISDLGIKTEEEFEADKVDDELMIDEDDVNGDGVDVNNDYEDMFPPLGSGVPDIWAPHVNVKPPKVNPFVHAPMETFHDWDSKEMKTYVKHLKYERDVNHRSLTSMEKAFLKPKGQGKGKGKK